MTTEIDAKAAETEIPGAGDLSAGWQAIIATRRRCVNDTLKALFAAGTIPKTIESPPFTQDDDKTYVAQVSIANAPAVISGKTRKIALKIALQLEVAPQDEFSSGASSVSAPSASDLLKRARTIHGGYAELTVNLENVHVSVKEETAEGLLLSFDLAGDLFDTIDLSHLEPKISKFGAAALLLWMNNAVRKILPLTFHIPKPWPSSLAGLVPRVAYTKVPGDAENDFMSVLFGLVGDLGSFALSPTILGDPAGANMAFVFSNRLIMKTIKAGMDTAARRNGLAFGFALSNDDPAYISNTKEVRFDVVPLMCVHLKRGDIQIFMRDNRFHVNVSFRYMNMTTFCLWNAMRGTSVTSFASDNGNLRLTFVRHLNVPWTVFVNLFTPFMLPLLVCFKALIPDLLDGEGESLIFVPGFDVSSIATPSYVHISGKVNRDKKRENTVGVVQTTERLSSDEASCTRRVRRIPRLCARRLGRCW